MFQPFEKNHVFQVWAHMKAELSNELKLTVGASNPGLKVQTSWGWGLQAVEVMKHMTFIYLKILLRVPKEFFKFKVNKSLNKFLYIVSYDLSHELTLNSPSNSYKISYTISSCCPFLNSSSL